VSPALPARPGSATASQARNRWIVKPPTALPEGGVDGSTLDAARPLIVDVMAATELGSFLRARRAMLSPLDVGRSDSSRRRVPGLRRGEVAELAQISVEYYIELEQGRGRSPSDQVVAALARALRLDRDERDYLFGLAGVTVPPTHGPTAHVDAAMLDLLDKLPDVPAQLFTDLYELVAQNSLATALLDEPISVSGLDDSQVCRWFLDPMSTRACRGPTSATCAPPADGIPATAGSSSSLMACGPAARSSPSSGTRPRCGCGVRALIRCCTLPWG
jgi:transcriptional regulator with XRE-family HTH domain